MKPIKVLTTTTPGLRAFLEAYPPTTDWEVFRNFVDYVNGAGNGAHHELIDALSVNQRGLCAYCELGLTGTDRQVEHFMPKAEYPASTYERENLFAACKGGTNPHSPDRQRKALKPSRRSCSCGQYKDRNTSSPVPVPKPTVIPPFPALFEVDPEGHLQPVADACEKADLDYDQVLETVEDCLNLNCERLKLARQTVWRKLADDVAAEVENLPDPEDDDAFAAILDRYAKTYLLLDDSGELAAFFTTRRSFFGAIGERLLTNPEQWV